MASNAAKAARRATANQRLESEVHTAADRLGIELPAPPRLASDPNLASIQRIEYQADILATINAAVQDTSNSGDAKPRASRGRKGSS